MPRNPKNLGKLLFIFPIFIIIGEFLFYYLDDFLDEGHNFLYLDNYGRGFLTWWFDSESFWGNFKYNIIKSLILAGTLLMFSRKTDIATIKPFKENRSMKFLVGLFIICLIPPMILINYSPGSGEPVNIVNIIFGGWFSTYMAYNILDFILFNFGIWVVLIAVYGYKNKYEPVKYNYYTMIFMSVSFAFLIHLSLVGSWDIESIFHLSFVMDTAIFLFFIFPLTLGWISLINKGENQENNQNQDSRLNKRYWKIQLSIRLILFVLIAIIIFLLFLTNIDPIYLTLDLGIDIGSDWIARNFSSWIFISLLSAIFYYFGIRGLSKGDES